VLGWTSPAFDIPAEVYAAWGAIATRGHQARAVWAKRLDADLRARDFMASVAAVEISPLKAKITAYKAQLSVDAPKVATRKASEMALEIVNATLPNTVGGSADLTGSNNTRTKSMQTVTRGDYSGDYINYGVREHGMAAAMNGIALHGGFVPYGGTFLVFADYCRPAIRLSALMGQPVTYVLTHDSIGLGEDGPTHQPLETIASLRAIPNLNVFRPADAVETAEAWELATTAATTPSALCLSRQGLPTVRVTHTDENLTARVAYVLRKTPGDRDVTLIATGSEIEIAMQAPTP
jgi:transketolase